METTLRRRIIETVWNWRLPCRTATQIAHDLNADPASVSSLLKKLADRKIIRREQKRGAWVYWLLLLAFVPRPAAAQITWSGPKLTPAEAAAVLAQCPCLSNVANRPAPLPEGPVVASTGSRPGALSWLDFPPERPARRLDGTLLSDPPTIYGLPPWYPPVVLSGGPFRGTAHPRREGEHRGKRP